MSVPRITEILENLLDLDATSLTIKSEPNSTAITGNITLSGSAQQLHSNTATQVFTVQANPGNVGYVYVGQSDVSSTIHMAALSRGSSITFTLNNLNLIYVRGTAGDKVSVAGEA